MADTELPRSGLVLGAEVTVPLPPRCAVAPKVYLALKEAELLLALRADRDVHELPRVLETSVDAAAREAPSALVEVWGLPLLECQVESRNRGTRWELHW